MKIGYLGKGFEEFLTQDGGCPFGGIRRIYSFENGYGASIIRHNFSYGGDIGLFELAVLHQGRLCYDTEITNDVLGWLKVEEVNEYLEKIKELNKDE